MRNSEVFLAAFAAIEKHLRGTTSLSKTAGFSDLVRDAAQRSRAVARYADDLREYADLRNAIVHERSGGRVIAEPNPRAVRHLEQVRDAVIDPPGVLPSFQATVEARDISTPIGQIALLMVERSYSQIPITKHDRFVALLTADAIARWLAAEVPTGMVELETPAERVLRHTEDPENYSLVGRHATLFDVLQAFDTFQARGKRLHAVLVTQHGKPTEKLLGIVTPYDIPKLLRQIAPRRETR